MMAKHRMKDAEVEAILDALGAGHPASLTLELCVKDATGVAHKTSSVVAKNLRRLMTTVFVSLGWVASTLVDPDSMSDGELNESIAAALAEALLTTASGPRSGTAQHKVLAGCVPGVASLAWQATHACAALAHLHARPVRPDDLF